MDTKEKLAALGVIPGAQVKGLFQQTLRDNFTDVYGDIETIKSIKASPENPNAVIIKTNEMNERETFTVNGKEVPIPKEAREYEVVNTDMIHLHDESATKSVRLADQDVELRVVGDNIETEFSVIPKALLNSLLPFINYVTTTRDELDQELDVESLGIHSDGIVYPVGTLLEFAKSI